LRRRPEGAPIGSADVAEAEAQRWLARAAANVEKKAALLTCRRRNRTLTDR
jgi:hypothetical protein